MIPLQHWQAALKARLGPRGAALATAGLGLLALAVVVGLGSLARPAGEPAAPAPASGLTLVAGVLVKLGLVLGLAYACLFALRRWQGQPFGAAGRRHLAVVETVRLSPRQALHLVRVGGQVVLVGATDQSLSLLTDVPDWPAPVEAPAEAVPAAGFSSLLSQLRAPQPAAVDAGDQ